MTDIWSRCTSAVEIKILALKFGNSQWWNVTGFGSHAVLIQFLGYLYFFLLCASFYCIYSVTLALQFLISSKGWRECRAVDARLIIAPSLADILFLQTCGPEPCRSTELWLWKYTLAFMKCCTVNTSAAKVRLRRVGDWNFVTSIEKWRVV